MTRYTAIIDRIIIVLESTRWRGQNFQSCSALLWIDELLVVLTWLAIASFSALRGYVLSGRKVWLPVVMILFGLVLPVASIYTQVITTTVLDSPFKGCDSNMNISLNMYRILATGARTSSIVTDLLVLAITFRHTYTMYAAHREENTPTLGRILLKNGFIYFFVLFLFNTFDIILLQIVVNGAAADLVTILSVILISRFLLDLCEVGAIDRGSDVVQSSETVVFNRQSGAESIFERMGSFTGINYDGEDES